MMPFTNARPLAGGSLALALALAGWSPASDAATTRVHFVVPTAVCDAPLPQYDASLRKRPRAIANEGTSSIYITCSAATDPVADEVDVGLTFVSNGPAATVQCTAVSGTTNTAVYTVKSTDVIANGRDWISWPALTGTTFALSCNLPPGIEMQEVMLRQRDAGGAL